MTHPRPHTATAITLALALALFASGCSTASEVSDTETKSAIPDASENWLADYDLDGLDGREITEYLDAMPVADRPEELIASVEPETLVLYDTSGNETTVPLPEYEFYLSFAPFIEHTHECHFHSLTTCLGELANEEIDITVTDETDAVLVDEAVRTYDNGFAGLWLPRDIEATLTVTQGERSATVPISTAEDAPTCLTTLQLT